MSPGDFELRRPTHGTITPYRRLTIIPFNRIWNMTRNMTKEKFAFRTGIWLVAAAVTQAHRGLAQSFEPITRLRQVELGLGPNMPTQFEHIASGMLYFWLGLLLVQGIAMLEVRVRQHYQNRSLPKGKFLAWLLGCAAIPVVLHDWVNWSTLWMLSAALADLTLIAFMFAPARVIDAMRRHPLATALFISLLVWNTFGLSWGLGQHNRNTQTAEIITMQLLASLSGLLVALLMTIVIGRMKTSSRYTGIVLNAGMVLGLFMVIVAAVLAPRAPVVFRLPQDAALMAAFNERLNWIDFASFSGLGVFAVCMLERMRRLLVRSRKEPSI